MEKTRKKKAQEEIAGFVVIVLIVMIIGVILLSLGIRPKIAQKSGEISNLLEATMYVTTDCAVGYIPQYKDMQELVKGAYLSENEKCLDGRTYKVVLNETLYNIIKSSLDVNEDSPNKAYRMYIYYRRINASDRVPIMELDEGNFMNCSSKPGGNHFIPAPGSSGNINIELETCKGKV